MVIFCDVNTVTVTVIITWTVTVTWIAVTVTVTVMITGTVTVTVSRLVGLSRQVRYLGYHWRRVKVIELSCND